MHNQIKTAFTVVLGVVLALIVLSVLSGALATSLMVNQAAPAANSATFYGTPNTTQSTSGPSYSSNFSNAFTRPITHGQDTLLATINSGSNPYLPNISFLVIISIVAAIAISMGVSHRLNRQLD